MVTDLLLAIAHHLLVFALTALLVGELVLVRQGMSSSSIGLVARVDVFFGATAGAVLVVGFLRVFLGARPEEFYLQNPTFWAKIAAFLAVGLLSIGPTLRFVGWSRRLKADPSYRPPVDQVRTVRRFVTLEAAIFFLIPVFAALMARRGAF